MDWFVIIMATIIFSIYLIAFGFVGWELLKSLLYSLHLRKLKSTDLINLPPYEGWDL
jgi:hypothetical protein